MEGGIQDALFALLLLLLLNLHLHAKGSTMKCKREKKTNGA
jgi:hypothetical protein